MKRIVATLALLCSVTLAAYSTGIPLDDGHSTTIFAVDDGDGNPVLALDMDVLFTAFEEEFGDGTIVHNVTLDWDASDPETHYYLVAHGTLDGRSHNMAVQLTHVDGSYYALGIRHKCEGNPCSGCEFKKDKKNKIIGCTCAADATGVCNHSIETTSAMAEESGSPYGIGMQP